MRSNFDDRKDLIKDLGEEEFLSNDAYKHLRDIPPPKCFNYIYNVFIELYNGSKEMITFTDIDCWCRVRKTNLSQYEVDLIRRMSVWADSAISELKESED